MKVVQNGGTIWGHELAQFTRELFPNLESPVLYEVGAYDGRDAKSFKDNCPSSQVYLFEGSPATYDQHLKGIEYGRAFNVAVDDCNSRKPYFVREEGGLSGLYTRGDGNNPEPIMVQCVRFENFINLHSLPLPDVMKIDVEGGTLEVLQGMGSYIHHVSLMHLETEEKNYYPSQSKHSTVTKFLADKDFECLLLHQNDGQNDSLWIRKRI